MKTELKQKEWEALSPQRRAKLTEWFEGSFAELVAVTTVEGTTYSIWKTIIPRERSEDLSTYDLVRSFGIGNNEAVSVDVRSADADELMQKLLDKVAEK